MARPIEEHLRLITTKGQVTIPAEIRRRLKVKPGDRIAFRVINGRVELAPPTMTLESAFGSVKPRKRPENFKELRDIAIEEKVKKTIDEMKR